MAMKSIIILILSSIISCFFGKETDSIQFINLHKSYKISDKMEFKIKNNFPDTVFYYIGIEGYMDERWREIINDINRPLSKSSRILKLASGEENKTVFPFKSLPEGYHNRFDKFRLVVNFGFSEKKMKKKTYSASFEITDN